MEKTLIYSILTALVGLGSITTNSLISGLAVSLLGPYGHAILGVLSAVALLASVILAQQSKPVVIAQKSSTPTQSTVTTTTKAVTVQAPVEPVPVIQTAPAVSTEKALQATQNFEKGQAQVAESKAAVLEMLNKEFPPRTSVVTATLSK